MVLRLLLVFMLVFVGQTGAGRWPVLFYGLETIYY